MGHKVNGFVDKNAHYVFAPLVGSQKEYNEREQWCIDNLKGGFHHDVTGGHFYDQLDAVTFLMEWAWKQGHDGVFRGEWP